MSALSDLIGESPVMRALRRDIRRLLEGQQKARRLPAILIDGETGTGKGLVARILHDAGPRAQGRFVDVNCAAIPEPLLEAELFGFERGAFTDAHRSKPGLFQTAHRGVIFLDEVGLLHEPLQAKLLSALEDRSVRRLGATRAEPIDAWVLSATNEDLRVAIRERRFREDLYHRLAVLTLRLPPLRERGSDVLVLAEQFMARACQEYGLPPRRFAPDAQARLLAYRWPGNVREVANVIERVALLSEREVISADMLGLDAAPGAGDALVAGRSGVSAKAAASEHLRATLDRLDWNISRTAATLGLSRNTIRARIERFGLERHAPGRAAVPPSPAADAPVATPPAPAAPAPSSIRWEQRSVTFLRIALTPTAPDEDITETSRALETIVDKLRTFGGRMTEIGRTGLDATFGLEPLDDAPARAANAALTIVHALGADRSLGVRLAMDTASVLAGRISETVEVDRAHRRDVWQRLEELLAMAEPGSVMVTSATGALLERRFDLGPGPRGGVRLRGRGGSRLALWGRMERFIGRDREMDLLGARWAAAARGQGQLVGLVGEPGVGKSRLLWEFVRSVRSSRVLQATAVALGTPAPFSPIVEMLRAHLALDAADDHERVRTKVAEHVSTLDPAFTPIVPALLALLGVGEDDAAWAQLDPRERRQRTLDAVKALLLRESRRAPLLIAVEDAHWLDSESQALLEALADGLPTASLMLMVTFRPEYQPRWGARTYYTHVRVDPLEARPAQQLVLSLIGDDPSLGAVPARLIEWTGGNPLFVEEMVRTLVETATLRGERGAYRLAKPVEDIVVPGTVTEVLAARINRLGEPDRAVLQSAAVIGRDVPYAVLALMAEPEATLRPCLARLGEAEFLYERSVYPTAEYTFKHALTHAVAYQTLPDRERRAGHGRVLDAMEKLYAGRVDEHVERLAHHALESHRWVSAVRYAHAAGHRAFARFANREAAAHFERALEALRRLPESRETLEQAIDLRLALRNALTPLGEAARTLERLREAEVLAERLGDAHRLARARAFQSNALYLVGDFTAALEIGARASAAGEQLGDMALQTAAAMYQGRALVAVGRYEDAVAILTPVVMRLSGEHARDRLELPVFPAVFARSHLVDALIEVGRLDDAARHAGDALAVAQAVEHPDTLFWAWYTLGVVALARGVSREAVPSLERALEVARANDLPIYAPSAVSAVATASALEGRVNEALPALRSAVEDARRRRQTLRLGENLLRLGDAALRAGADAEAETAAADALQLARRHGMRGVEAYALQLRGAIAERSRVLDAARAAYVEAADLAQALGMRPLSTRCRAELDRLG